MRAKAASFFESGGLGFVGTMKSSEEVRGFEVWPGISPPSSSAVQGGESEPILTESVPTEEEVKAPLMAPEVVSGSAALPLAGEDDMLVPLAVIGIDGEFPLCPWRRVFKNQGDYKCARRNTGQGRIGVRADVDTASVQANKGCSFLFHMDDVDLGQYKGRRLVARNSARSKEKIKTEEEAGLGHSASSVLVLGSAQLTRKVEHRSIRGRQIDHDSKKQDSQETIHALLYDTGLFQVVNLVGQYRSGLFGVKEAPGVGVPGTVPGHDSADTFLQNRYYTTPLASTDADCRFGGIGAQATVQAQAESSTICQGSALVLGGMDVDRAAAHGPNAPRAL